MEFLINPNSAYLLVIAAIVLMVATTLFPKHLSLKVGAVLCLGLALYELWVLKANMWALVVVALSVLPFLRAMREMRFSFALFALTILLLIVGSAFLFTDQDGRPLILRLTVIVSMLAAEFIWIAMRRASDRNNPRGNDRDSLIGLTGEAYTDIHEFGSVRAVGEIWQANSKVPIPAGSTVRIVRQTGLILTVKKVEKLTK